MKVRGYLEHSQDTPHSLYSSIKVHLSASFSVQNKKSRPKSPQAPSKSQKFPEISSFQQYFILSTKKIQVGGKKSAPLYGTLTYLSLKLSTTEVVNILELFQNK